MKFLAALTVWVSFAAISLAQDKSAVPISQEYQLAYQQSAEVFQKGNYEEALKLLDRADGVQADVAAGYNLRGAIYTKQQKYAEAEKAFQKAWDLNQKLYLPLFNLAEVAFLQKNYEESHKRFELFVQKNGSNDLAEFKLFLCDLLGNKADRAKATLDAKSPDPMTPVYFYMKAAWYFSKDKKDAALEEVQSAVNVYPAGQNNAFAETFIDLGWLNRKENEQSLSALPDSVLAPTPQTPAANTPKLQPATGLDSLMPSLDKDDKDKK